MSPGRPVDARGVVTVLMVDDTALEKPAFDVIRRYESAGFPAAIQIVPFDSHAVRSQVLWSDGQLRAYVLARFIDRSAEVVSLVEDQDVAVLIWNRATEVCEMYIRSDGRVRWRGNGSTENAYSAIQDFFRVSAHVGAARAAAAQRWRSAAEALLRGLRMVVDERDALLAELRRTQVHVAAFGSTP